GHRHHWGKRSGDDGSEITDVSDHYGDIVLKASLDAKDPFVCQKDTLSVEGVALVKGKWSTCGTLPVLGNAEVCYPPTCRLYSVDGSFEAGRGLVTEQYKADFVLLCTQDANVCRDCMTVKGPRKYKVKHFSKVQGPKASYLLSVEWDEDYYGPVHVSINAEARYLESCSLDLVEPYWCEGSAEYDKIQVVEPIEIRRVKSTQVRPLSYKLYSGCDGQHCDQVAHEEEPVEEREEVPRRETYPGHRGPLPSNDTPWHGEGPNTRPRDYWLRPSQRDQPGERLYETPYIGQNARGGVYEGHVAHNGRYAKW
ncbi:unnamed protein product, partial [Ostreobium quekettii]